MSVIAGCNIMTTNYLVWKCFLAVPENWGSTVDTSVASIRDPSNTKVISTLIISENYSYVCYYGNNNSFNDIRSQCIYSSVVFTSAVSDNTSRFTAGLSSAYRVHVTEQYLPYSTGTCCPSAYHPCISQALPRLSVLRAVCEHFSYGCRFNTNLVKDFNECNHSASDQGMFGFERWNVGRI